MGNRYYIFLFLILFFAFSAKAQVDTNKRIQLNGEVNTGTPSSNSSIFDLPTSTNVEFGRFRKTQPKEDFLSPSELRTPEVKIKQKFKEDEERPENFRSDQYLGDFRSNGKFVRIVCRDHGYQDGDLIRVLVNDEVVKQRILLTTGFKAINIDLQPGFNKIDFEALNQGEAGPNTAEFRVYDDFGKVISANKWNLATGFKATVIIVKE